MASVHSHLIQLITASGMRNQIVSSTMSTFFFFSGLLESELHTLLSYYCNLSLSNKRSVFQDVMNTNLSAESMIPQAQFIQLLRALRGFLTPTTAIRFVPSFYKLNGIFQFNVQHLNHSVELLRCVRTEVKLLCYIA